MPKQWNIKGGMAADMSGKKYKIAYRAQSYKHGFSEANGDSPGAYSFYNFTDHPNRRFVPNKIKDTAYYMGFDPLAVFVESNNDFREVSDNSPRPLPFSDKELQKTEIIAFTDFDTLKLFDLNSSLALNRHNIRPSDPELVSLDYTASSVLADEIYAEGYEGILFRTRQGIIDAAVIWGRAENKIKTGRIIYRKSALTVINSIHNAQNDLGIKIIEEIDEYK